jgi:transposase
LQTIPVAGRFDLTDGQWALLEPLLPVGVGLGRPRKWPLRRLIDGIRWRIRVGAPWRDVPAVYGPWESVYGLFRRWQLDGTWAAVVTGLQAAADAAGRIRWDVSVDSTIVRAHQHAAGAGKRGSSEVIFRTDPTSNPTTTLSAGLAAVCRRNCIWPANKAVNPWLCY